MGPCCSRQSPETQSARYNQQLEKFMRRDDVAEQKKIRLLLLGPGESGKSTIFKQFKILYGKYTDEDLIKMTPYVYMNVITEIKNLLDQADVFGLLGDVQDSDAVETVLNTPDTAVVDETLGNRLLAIWNDPVIKNLWNRRNEFQVLESLSYFMNEKNLRRIVKENFQAETIDVLHVRIRSSGITVDRYDIDGHQFEMYDVGGQRNERKKWIHCFDNVTSVIYVAALSEFDQGMYEDESSNRMKDAIELYRELCNSPYFQTCSIILFLNKKDLFEEKIKRKNISDTIHFSDYNGARNSYEEGLNYFRNLFEIQQKGSFDRYYHHVTCATDKNNVQFVFTSCKDTILQKAIRQFIE